MTQEDFDNADWPNENDDTYEFYFIVNGNQSEKLNVEYSEAIPVCTEILCSDYLTAGRCNSDPCDISQNDYNCNEGDSCTCVWDDARGCDFAKAGPNPNPENGLGDYLSYCAYDETSDDNCDDGYLDYSWTAVLSWPPENTFDVQADCEVNGECEIGSDGKYHLISDFVCEDGNQTMLCPAQIQLPFFNVWNLIVAVVLVALVYWFLEIRHHRRTPKRKEMGQRKPKTKGQVVRKKIK